MIDVKELRIGNLVIINNKVIEMTPKIFHAVIHCFPGYDPKYIHPIPITEEWLLKFGLYRSEDNIYFYIGYYGICLYEESYLDYGVKSNPNANYLIGYVKYIHELQNLYNIL